MKEHYHEAPVNLQFAFQQRDRQLGKEARRTGDGDNVVVVPYRGLS